MSAEERSLHVEETVKPLVEAILQVHSYTVPCFFSVLSSAFCQVYAGMHKSSLDKVSKRDFVMEIQGHHTLTEGSSGLDRLFAIIDAHETESISLVEALSYIGVQEVSACTCPCGGWLRCMLWFGVGCR